MMYPLNGNNFSMKTCFEDLPDETLLTICRYLSPVNVLDSLLNLNNRFNKTITLYRKKIFISNLSYKDFYHLLNYHLPYLAADVYYLYINNCSMSNVGKIFEEKFNKIDQEFPLLNQLIFHKIDIETLENLSWRFNTMYYLRELDIDIADNRLSSMPPQFDEFLCGKLFSQSNSFERLKLNLNNYRFNLQSITRECLNIRYLTISVKRLDDLLTIFEYFRNIEQLNITIGCSLPYDKINDTYSYEHLWWKLPYLTKFILNIEEKELISHDYIISHEIIIKIVQNLYSLLYFKFLFNIKFTSTLQITTTKDIYINKYFTYIDGTLWQKALERNDNRNIQFELYIEIDGFANNQLKRMMSVNEVVTDRNDDIDFNSQLKTTFSSAYWLQKNISIQCFSTSSKHVSIYTLPITNSHRTTTIDIIDKEISIKSSPLHVNIHNLSIISNNDYLPSKLSITNLFTKFPRLTNLKIDTELLLPPIITICSNRLHTLSVCNYSLVSCNQLLDYLPQVRSLTITNSLYIEINSCPKPFSSIIQLRLTIDSIFAHSLSNINKYFPNLNEFYLIIKCTMNQLVNDYDQWGIFERLTQGFSYLRYMEITFPIEKDTPLIQKWMNMPNSDRIKRIKTSDGRYMVSKIWL